MLLKHLMSHISLSKVSNIEEFKLMKLKITLLLYNVLQF